MYTNEAAYLPTHELNALEQLRASASTFLNHLERKGIDIHRSEPDRLAYNYSFNYPRWQPPIPIDRAGFPVEIALFNALKECTQVDAQITIVQTSLEDCLSTYSYFAPEQDEAEIFENTLKSGLDKPFLELDSRAYLEEGQIMTTQLVVPLSDLRQGDWSILRRLFKSVFIIEKGVTTIPHMLSYVDISPMMAARMSKWYVKSLTNSHSITDRRTSSGLPFNNPW